MSMYNVIEYSDSYSKESDVLWQYCRENTIDDLLKLILLLICLKQKRPW